MVTATHELTRLAKLGLIGWPVLVNWPKEKTPYPRYCGYGTADPHKHSRFDHGPYRYELRYHDGCFFPFLYKCWKGYT